MFCRDQWTSFINCRIPPREATLPSTYPDVWVWKWWTWVFLWLWVSEVSGYVSTQNESQICPSTPFGGFLWTLFTWHRSFPIPILGVWTQYHTGDRWSHWYQCYFWSFIITLVAFCPQHAVWKIFILLRMLPSLLQKYSTRIDGTIYGYISRSKKT